MKLIHQALKLPLTIFLITLGGCTDSQNLPNTNQSNNSPLTGSIAIDGSSTVYPITEAMAEEFQGIHPKVRMTVGISGTGGGFKKFCSGETDISNASRPIKTSEIETCAQAGIEFIELPVAFDAVSVVINPDNDWASCLTTEELQTIWKPEAQGKIKTWNQIRSDFPKQPIHLYGPGTDSGTFDYFTDAINGDEGVSRGDYTASEDDNVIVQGVSNDVGALGYFGLAYFEENADKLKAVKIDDNNPDNGEGCIKPSIDAVDNSTYQPLARPIFIYVARSSLDRPEVLNFLQFYLSTTNRQYVSEVGYVPISEKVYEKVQKRLENKTTGSVFKGGSTVGVKLDEVL